MSLAFRILGTAGGDNALFVEIDTGQSLERLLFDCGEGCASVLSLTELRSLDHLFFSHLHMDHIGGFDSFFRATFDQASKPNRIWGPPETARILQHRFQGYRWNLHDALESTWLVSEIDRQEVRTTRFELREAFAAAHDGGVATYQQTICTGAGYKVDAVTLNHRIPSIGYIVREKPRKNIDPTRMAALGLRPGPWLKQVKEAPDGEGEVLIDGAVRSIEELRKALVVETAGESIAYLTDFLVEGAEMDALAGILRGCRTIVCDGQYRHADLELARKHFHMTTSLSATLARKAGAEKLILFHVSGRYGSPEWVEMLNEARQIFPNAGYPEHWNLEPGAR